MPYLYAAAVESHATGVPMLRPMVLEYPEDLTAQMLDRQYMLGQGLLIAPVLASEGQVDYYLPEGKWTNLLSEKAAMGGKWQKETHGFLSLPIMVRENTVLPLGSCDTKPDYDFLDGVTLHLYQMQDGAGIETVIPDLQGKPAATFVTTRKGNQFTVETDSKKPYTVAVHGVVNVVGDCAPISRENTGVTYYEGKPRLFFMAED